MKNIQTRMVALLLAALAGCNVLQQEPVSEITADKAFESEVDLRAALMGGYNRLAFEPTAQAQEMPIRYLMNGELRTDSYISRIGGQRAFIQGNFDNTFPWANWQNYYVTVRALNNVLGYGRQIPAERFGSARERDRLLGEAHFLRGFVYFNMLRVWENLVLRTEPYESATVDFNAPQAPPAEVMRQIEADLLEAASLLPREYPGSTRARATRGAAHGLLAKFYVYQSSPYAQQRLNAGSPQWGRAAAFADSVIRNPQYNLLPASQYSTLFTQGSTRESIWEVGYDAQIPGPNQTNRLTAWFLPRRFAAPTGGNMQWQPSDKLIDAFRAVGDSIRFNAAMAEVRTQDGWERVDVGRTAGVPQRYNNHYVRKYPGSVISNVRFGDSEIIMLRLADVILLRAEALFEQGNVAAAQQELNKITDRAGIARRTVSVREILQQRWLELCFEGDRWFDLKRRQLLEQETGPFAAFPKGYTFPIVNGELINNPLVRQNEGW